VLEVWEVEGKDKEENVDKEAMVGAEDNTIDKWDMKSLIPKNRCY
jgi:hypothetical protein